jgi:hypothetical protein
MRNKTRISAIEQRIKRLKQRLVAGAVAIYDFETGEIIEKRGDGPICVLLPPKQREEDLSGE